MPNLTQYQIAILAFLAGGLIVILVFLLTSGGDSDGDQAASRTPTATAAPSRTPAGTAQATPTGEALAAVATGPPPAPTTAPPTTAPPPAATATSPPPPTATPPSPTPTSTATPPPTPTATVATGAWHGSWETDCTGSTCGVMDLLQTGNTVVGTYANGSGTINGTVSGNRLTGTWSRNGISGPIDYWMVGAGQRWYGSYNGSFGWCGRRAGGSYPTPCGVSSWSGTWDTNCPASCGSLVLQQDGTSVSGTYAGGAGSVSGTVDGTTFSGTWFRGAGSGPFTFFMLGGGQRFNGNYNTSFMWCGHRGGAGDPNPCLNN